MRAISNLPGDAEVTRVRQRCDCAGRERQTLGSLARHPSRQQIAEARDAAVARLSRAIKRTPAQLSSPKRLLYRLSTTRHRERFVLKGAMLMTTWFQDPFRPTRDLDLLGFGDPDPQAMLAVFREIRAVTADDGVVFDVEGLAVDLIREELQYGGLRIKTNAMIDGARVRIVGVTELELPVLLDLPSPHRLVTILQALPMPKSTTRVIKTKEIADSGIGSVLARLMMIVNDMAIVNESLRMWSTSTDKPWESRKGGGRALFARVQMSYVFEALEVIKEIRDSKALTAEVQKCTTKTQDSFAVVKGFIDTDDYKKLIRLRNKSGRR
jgi:hypothetical protein